MQDDKHKAATIVHNNLLPRVRFLQQSFAAIAEQKRETDTANAAVYDGAAFVLEDIAAAALAALDALEE